MPLKNYSVLKGRPIAMRLGTGKSPHYQVHIVAADEDFRIAINIESGDGSEVEFLMLSPFDHPLTDQLKELEHGIHPQPTTPDSLAFDYIRGNLFEPQDMVPLPLSAPGPDNDLNEKLDHYVQRALSNENAVVYAFGETWGPEPKKRDNYFGFKPGRGIHDIHMNQGNPGPPEGQQKWFDDNGIRQDGGLVFEYPEQNLWVAIFLKFQTQAWHTDDETGHPLDLGGEERPNERIAPDHVPTEAQPDGLIQIISALVNSVKTPEREVVTLLNTADRDIDLDGWMLADKRKNKMKLTGTIAAGGTLAVVVKKPMELSNKGGIISLLDDRGVKIHGVSYTKADARIPGLTIVF